MKLSKEDLNAIMLDKAFANKYSVSDFLYCLAWQFGHKVYLNTHAGGYVVTQFFGKQYA